MKHMRLNMIAFLIFMTALMLLSGCGGPEGESVFAPSRPDVPAIVFDSTEHDFGTVPAGSENTCTFAFINDGGRDLQIESLHAPCGCTVVSPADRMISPGKSSELTVTFTAGAFPGVQKKTIAVVTNDPHNSRIDLWVTADVEKSSTYAAQQAPTHSPADQARTRPASPLSKPTQQSIRFLKNATN